MGCIAAETVETCSVEPCLYLPLSTPTLVVMGGPSLVNESDDPATEVGKAAERG